MTKRKRILPRVEIIQHFDKLIPGAYEVVLITRDSATTVLKTYDHKAARLRAGALKAEYGIRDKHPNLSPQQFKRVQYLERQCRVMVRSKAVLP